MKGSIKREKFLGEWWRSKDHIFRIIEYNLSIP